MGGIAGLDGRTRFVSGAGVGSGMVVEEVLELTPFRVVASCCDPNAADNVVPAELVELVVFVLSLAGEGK